MTQVAASPARERSEAPAPALDAPLWRLRWARLCESVDLDARDRVVTMGPVIQAPEGFGVRNLPLDLAPAFVVSLEAPAGMAMRAKASVTDEQPMTGASVYEWTMPESGTVECVLSCEPISIVEPGVFSFDLTINGLPAHNVVARLERKG